MCYLALMTVLHVIEAPDAFLKQKSLPVEKTDSALKKLAEDMKETMLAYNGIGLAAPQVGHLLRMIVVHETKQKLCVAREDRDKVDARMIRIFINPEIISRSKTLQPYEEGCLSVPKVYAEVKRPDHIRLRYQTLDGETHEEDFSDLMAVVLQHEIDHLDGILFVDYLSKLKKNLLLKRMEKLKHVKPS